jgi:hypothetical protein
MTRKVLNLFAPSKPHKGQQEVLDALDSGSRWILLRAGRKWRKTSLIISWLMERAISTGLVCPYIAPNKVQAKKICWDDHIQRILKHFKEIGFPYRTNEVELSVSFPELDKEGKIVSWKGGKVELNGVENKDALRGISNWGAVGGDEYDDWEEDIWPLIIRPNLLTHKAPALIAGTPKGYKNIYNIENPFDTKGNPTESIFKCFHFTSYDNPSLDQKELDDMVLEYKAMGMGYFRQEILAEYERPHGTVYEEWSENNYQTFDYDPFLPLHLSFDFGVNDPTAILWIQPNNGEFRIIDYYEAADASIEHFVQVIRSKPYKRPDLCTGDAAGKARSITTNTSPIEEYSKLGIFIKTKNGLQIPDQIRITHKYIPSLFLRRGSTERLRECLLNYRYPEKRISAFNQSNELPIHDKWSHGCRALEYYFANIDGGGLFRNYAVVAAANKAKQKKWSI